MEVASFSPLSPTYRPCRRQVRFLPKLSATLVIVIFIFSFTLVVPGEGGELKWIKSGAKFRFFCVLINFLWELSLSIAVIKGNYELLAVVFCTHKGFYIRYESLRSAFYPAQSSLPGIPRKHGSVPWQYSDTKVEACGLHHSCKFHVQSKFVRDVVVRSELATVGSPEYDYSLSKVKVKSMIRGACFYAVTAFTAIFLFILMLVGHPFVMLFDRHRRKYHHFIAKIWSSLTVTPFYKVNFEGLENLPPQDTPVVYVSNHQSFLDIYTVLTLGRSVKFISKTSIFLYPIIGWAMFLLGMIPLKRMDSRSQLDCLKRCMDLIKNGGSVFFFPEGTRSKDGKLGPFKKGAFSVAAKTNVPVVPITLMGTGQIMPAGREAIVNSGTVKVVIHRPIHGNDPVMLCEEARNTIASALDGQE